MALLYLREHLSCREYSLEEDAVMRIFHAEAGVELWEGYVKNSLIVFLLEGKLEVNCGSYFHKSVEAGQMFFIPNNAKISGVAVRASTWLTCVFDTSMSLCNRFSLENLTSLVDMSRINYDFTILPIRERLSQFLDLLRECLLDGLNCVHFHSFKRNEMMILLRGYYSKEELALLFYPALSVDLDLKDFALSHYNEVKDVREFAAMAKMTPVTFSRRFKKVFGEPVAQWLEKQKSKEVLREIEQTNKTFAEIADLYNFSSPAYLVTFCKRHFSKTPKELRESFLHDLSKK